MAKATARYPWFKFTPQDWRGDAGLRIVSLAARGLWIEMLCVMHEADPYGHLIGKTGKALTVDDLASVVGKPVEVVAACLSELEEQGVFSRTKAQVIVSRRMIRDHNRARKMRENGKMGGNPSLGKNEKIEHLDKPLDKPIDTRDQIPEGKKEEIAAASTVLQAPPPPVDGYSMSDAELAMVQAFDEALVASFGEGARRRRPAGTDRDTARQLVSLSIPVETFRQACLDVMGKAAVAARNPPGSLSYCLRAAMEAHAGGSKPAVRQVAVSANVPVGEDVLWRARLASYKANRLWPAAWGPHPGEAGCLVPKHLLEAA